MMGTSLAERLRIFRARAGLTVLEAAKRIGVDRHTLRRLELGEVSEPEYATVKKIAQFYGVSVAELMGDPEPARPKLEAPMGGAMGQEEEIKKLLAGVERHEVSPELAYQYLMTMWRHSTPTERERDRAGEELT
jgi:transcriptional regulator with XRE-family HTH domain